jgi:hypothetical protein
LVALPAQTKSGPLPHVWTAFSFARHMRVSPVRPPSPNRGKMTDLHFDPWQFSGIRAYPVSPTSGITYSDYGRMHCEQHDNSRERRLPTPLFALNDEILRELLVVYMEGRVGIHDPHGTLIERKERARQVALSQLPRLNARLDSMNRRYVEAQRNHAPAERLKELQIEIEILDTQIRTSREGGMALIAAICYLYHRLHLDSVGVAAELGIKPPHVRATLWRLNEIWKTKFKDNAVLVPKPACPPVRVWTKEGVANWAAAHPIPAPVDPMPKWLAQMAIEDPNMDWRRKKPKAPAPRPFRARRCVRSFDYDEAVRMIEAGLSFRKTAKQLGVSTGAIQHALKRKRGGPRRPAPVQPAEALA